MKINGLSAARFRVVLIIIISLTLIATGVSFYFALNQLKTFAAETNTLNNESATSSQKLNQLRELDSYLSDNSEAIKRAADITSSVDGYRYQDDFVRELSRLATQSEVNITSFSFNSSEGSGDTGSVDSGSTSEQAPSSSATPAAGSDNTAANSKATAQLKSISCTVNLESPLPYEKFITFLKLIESNPKLMQVASVSIGNTSGSTSSESGEQVETPQSTQSINSGLVSVEPLEVLVYLRQ